MSSSNIERRPDEADRSQGRGPDAPGEDSVQTLVDVVMPQMGVSVSEGTIVEWRKQVGDWVEYEEAIVDISTDKIDTEVPSPAAGRVAEIVVEVGTTVEVGTVLARLATDAKPGQAHASEQNGAPPTSEAAAATGETPVRGDRDAVPGAGHGHARRGAARAARGGRPPLLARGPAHRGRARRRPRPGAGHRARGARAQAGRARLHRVGAAWAADAEAAEPPLHIESPYRPEPPAPKPAPRRPPSPLPHRRRGPAAAAPAAAPGAYQPPAAAPLSRMRKLVGEHMKRSLDTAATCTTWIEADMSRVERARKQAGLTALPFVARASIDALREYPALNAWLEGDEHTVHSDVNLGIAVSLGDDGLIVPVIQSAQDLSAEGLSKRIKELARAARSRQLRPDDVQGATFTITNPGQFGSVMATPGHQPAAGRDPRPRGGRSSARWWSPTRTATTRSPSAR